MKKKKYVKPVFTNYGDIKKITKAEGDLGGDGITGDQS